MEDIIDTDYTHAKKACKDFNVQRDTLLLAYVFKNLQNTCFKIYELVLFCFINAPGWHEKFVLKQSKVKLDLVTNVNMLFSDMLLTNM